MARRRYSSVGDWLRKVFMACDERAGVFDDYPWTPAGRAKALKLAQRANRAGDNYFLWWMADRFRGTPAEKYFHARTPALSYRNLVRTGYRPCGRGAECDYPECQVMASKRSRKAVPAVYDIERAVRAYNRYSRA